jgi:hypothetical protein
MRILLTAVCRHGNAPDLHGSDERSAGASRTLEGDAAPRHPAPEAGGPVHHRRERSRRSAPAPLVVATTAGRSHTEDLRVRQRRYLLTQTVRVACLLLAATLPVGLPVKGAFLVGAVFLPYFGVVAANAGPARDRRRAPNLADRAVGEPTRLQIAPGRVVDAEPRGRVIDG